MKPPKQDFFSQWDLMALVLVIWLCSLPFIGLIIAPFLGIKTALTLALLLLILMLLYCWGSCILQFILKQSEKWSAGNSATTETTRITARIRARKYHVEQNDYA
jgi:hypothetical protein